MKFYGGLLVILLGVAVLYAASVANGPDFEIEFRREVTSGEPAAEISKAMTEVPEWPRWFHSLKEARESGSGEVLLKIEPPKKQWKRFDMKVRVLEKTPARLRIEVLEDSTGKLTRLFERLEWEVSATPGTGETRITGICRATTRHWRSRLFGRLSQRVLMHQVFYPNLIALSRITQPAQKAFLETQP